MTPPDLPPSCAISAPDSNSSVPSLIRGLQGEIAIHEAIFCWVLVPVFGIVLVAFSLTFSVSMAISSFLGISSHWVLPTACGVTLLMGCSVPLHLRLAKTGVARSGWRLFLYGPASKRSDTEFEDDEGEILAERVGSLWLQFAKPGAGVPEISWYYAGKFVGARALADIPNPAIAVSHALWTHVRSKQQIVDFILLHEMAHVWCGDVRRIASIDRAFLVARSSIICTLALIGPFAAAYWGWWVYDELAGLLSGGATPNGIAGPFSSLLACVLMLIPAPISLFILRRYAGFISSLIETRADLMAAHFGGGLESFVATFRDDGAVASSTWPDILKSLFDPAVTHPPTVDRLKILTRPDRLAAPKFRYFAMSMMLPALMYLNPALLLMPQLFWIGCIGQLICGSALLMNIALSLVLAGSGALPGFSISTRVLFVAAMQAVYLLPLFGGTRLVELTLSFLTWLTVPGANEALESAYRHGQAMLSNMVDWFIATTSWADSLSGLPIAFVSVSVVPILLQQLRRVRRHDLWDGVFLGCILVGAQWIAFFLRFDFPAFTINFVDLLFGSTPAPPKPWAFLVPVSLLVGGGVLSIIRLAERR